MEPIELKIERIRAGLSQGQLANRMGVNIRYISEWENGKRKLTLKNAKELFDAIKKDNGGT